jgi:hypothetical protein
MRITLTPGQAVTVFGWFNPKLTLAWSDVLANDGLTFSFLVHTANVPPSRLHQIQADGHTWIQCKKARLTDCAEMHECWNLHPITDFRADLADLIALKWPAETMLTLGLTYDHLLQVGLTTGTMRLFTHMTLASWAKVGFEKRHAMVLHEQSLVCLFNMTKPDVLKALR